MFFHGVRADYLIGRESIVENEGSEHPPMTLESHKKSPMVGNQGAF